MCVRVCVCVGMCVCVHVCVYVRGGGGGGGGGGEGGGEGGGKGTGGKSVSVFENMEWASCDHNIPSPLPTSLGSLCVPPAPGNNPNITSGSPTKVFGLRVAMR